MPNAHVITTTALSHCSQFLSYQRETKQLHFHISRHIAHLGWEIHVFFYTFYLVYIWHCHLCMLEFLIDNIFVSFGGTLFQHIYMKILKKVE
jgi:hypothetical protein